MAALCVDAAVESFMDMALKEGEAALEEGEVPVGCVFVRDGVVIGRAHNLTNATLDATRHAEIVVLSQMDVPDLTGVDLYVTCEPCVMCAAALGMYGLRQVFFGCSNDKFGGCGSTMNLHEPSINWPGYKSTSGIKETEAVNLFRAFYARSNSSAPKPRKKSRSS